MLKHLSTEVKGRLVAAFLSGAALIAAVHLRTEANSGRGGYVEVAAGRGQAMDTAGYVWVGPEKYRREMLGLAVVAIVFSGMFAATALWRFAKKPPWVLRGRRLRRQRDREVDWFPQRRQPPRL